jgi:hypothetical protein
LEALDYASQALAVDPSVLRSLVLHLRDPVIRGR